MEMIDFIRFVMIPTILTYIGYNERDKMIHRQKVLQTLPRDDIERLVDKSKEVHGVEIREIKSDIDRLESKIDKMIDLLIK